MAYICYKPKGSCVNCEHFRYDEDKERNCCWVAYDKEHNTILEQPKERKNNSIKEDK